MVRYYPVTLAGDMPHFRFWKTTPACRPEIYPQPVADEVQEFGSWH
jgi:hypothetical protein